MSKFMNCRVKYQQFDSMFFRQHHQKLMLLQIDLPFRSLKISLRILSYACIRLFIFFNV